MKSMTQLALIFSVCLLGEAISSFLPFAFPGTVLSMILLFVLFATKRIKVDKVRPASDFLTQNMAFFLIPPGVGILRSLDVLQKNILPFIVIVLISTILAFAAAAWTVQLLIRLQKRVAGEKKEV